MAASTGHVIVSSTDLDRMFCVVQLSAPPSNTMQG